MEEHNFDSIIKNIINESEDYYNSEALEAKEKIWNKIRYGNYSLRNTPIIRILAAACIILLILSASLSYSLISSNKEMKMPDNLTSSLENNIHHKNAIPEEPAESITDINPSEKQQIKFIHDTVVLEKKEIIYKTIEIEKQVVDTVFLEQLVYIEKEPDSIYYENMFGTNNPEPGINLSDDNLRAMNDFSFRDEYVLSTYNAKDENDKKSLYDSKVNKIRKFFVPNIKKGEYQPVIFGNLR